MNILATKLLIFKLEGSVNDQTNFWNYKTATKQISRYSLVKNAERSRKSIGRLIFIHTFIQQSDQRVLKQLKFKIYSIFIIFII